jgi:hypothetical protein
MMLARAWQVVSFRQAGAGYRILSFALGIFLLTTAGLKAYGLTMDPLAQDSFLASPRLLIATIEIETVLGIWLLVGWWPRTAWGFTLSFFALLAALSLYLALDGQRSCGCFGQMTVNPWLTFVLDVAVLAALMFCRPVVTAATISRYRMKGLLKIGAGSATFLAIISGVFLFVFQNPLEALARLRGESVTVVPSVANLGDGIRREMKEFPVELTNRSGKPIRILGGTTTCSCITTTDLPLTLKPGESRSIIVGFKFQGSVGSFRHHFVLYTDDKQQAVVIARFTGRVIDPPP